MMSRVPNPNLSLTDCAVSVPLPLPENPSESGGGGGGGGGENPGGGSPGGGDGGGEGGEEGAGATDADLARAADEFVAGVIGEAGAGASPQGEGREGEGRDAPHAEPDPIDDFIKQNYGGDRHAFVASLYEQRTNGQRMAKEIDDLKVKLEGKPRDKDADAKAALEADADVQSLNQQIKDDTTRWSQLGQRNLELTTQARQLESNISTLEAEIPLIEDPKEVAKKTQQVNKARLDLLSTQNEFLINETNRQRLYDKVHSNTKELKRAEKVVRDRIDEEEKEQKRELDSVNRTRASFVAAFDEHIKPFKLDPKSKRFLHIREAVRTQLADFLDSRSDDDPGLDAAGISNAVNQLIAAYAEANDMKPPTTTTPSRKPPVTPPSNVQRRIMTPPRPNGQGGQGQGQPNANPNPNAPTPPRTADEVLSNPDLVRKRAAAVFQAAARGGAGRALRGGRV